MAVYKRNVQVERILKSISMNRPHAAMWHEKGRKYILSNFNVTIDVRIITTGLMELRSNSVTKGEILISGLKKEIQACEI